MRRQIGAIAVLCGLWASALQAQVQSAAQQSNLTSATCSATDVSGCVALALSGAGGIAIQLQGTFTATVQFEGTVDGATWVALSMTPSNATVTVTSATAPGVWFAGSGGLQAVRARVSAYTSGTVITNIRSALTSALRTGGATIDQLRVVGSTVPTCSGSCGTSPSVVGSDTAMIVTMGASGVPASPFTITFHAAWAAAPSCQGSSALASMVVGKMPIALVSSTTTLQVTTNGTAPATSDKYQFVCVGVQ